MSMWRLEKSINRDTAARNTSTQWTVKSSGMLLIGRGDAMKIPTHCPCCGVAATADTKESWGAYPCNCERTARATMNPLMPVCSNCGRRLKAIYICDGSNFEMGVCTMPKKREPRGSEPLPEPLQDWSEAANARSLRSIAVSLQVIAGVYSDKDLSEAGAPLELKQSVAKCLHGASVQPFDIEPPAQSSNMMWAGGKRPEKG